MSSRSPDQPDPDPRRRTKHAVAPRPALALEPDDVAELRRSIRVVRRLVGRGMALGRRMAPANDDAGPGTAAAGCHGLARAFLRSAAPTPSLLAAWLVLCHETTGDLLGEPTAEILLNSDDPALDAAELLALLDEVEERLDRLQGRSEVADRP